MNYALVEKSERIKLLPFRGREQLNKKKFCATFQLLYMNIYSKALQFVPDVSEAANVALLTCNISISEIIIRTM